MRRCPKDILKNLVRGKLGPKCQRLTDEPLAPETLLVERNQPCLEVKADFASSGARRDVVRAAEGG